MAATTYRRVPDLGSSDLRSEKDVSDGSDSANDVGEFQPRLEGFHKPRESLLTNSAGWITKRGFINFFIILVVSHRTFFQFFVNSLGSTPCTRFNGE